MGGVILAAAGEATAAGELVSRGRHVVAVDRAPSGLDVDAVLIDGRNGARLATRALMEQGFQRIVCITGPPDVESAVSRRRVGRCRRGPGRHYCRPPPPLRLPDRRRSRSHGGLARPAQPPDAVFAANNLTGLGALQVLLEHGLAPPAFGLAVFGDLPFALHTPPGIVTVSSPSRHLGETAARLLLERIGGDDQPARTVMLRATLTSA